jgi:hypothetical protein
LGVLFYGWPKETPSTKNPVEGLAPSRLPAKVFGLSRFTMSVTLGAKPKPLDGLTQNRHFF